MTGAGWVAECITTGDPEWRGRGGEEMEGRAREGREGLTVRGEAGEWVLNPAGWDFKGSLLNQICSHPITDCSLHLDKRCRKGWRQAGWGWVGSGRVGRVVEWEGGRADGGGGGTVRNGTYELVCGLMVVLPKAADQLHMRNTGGIFESMISKCCFGLADYMRGLPCASERATLQLIYFF